MLKVDVRQIEGFSTAATQAPLTLAQELAKAYRDMGRQDISTLQQSLSGKFNIKSKALLKSFKTKASNPNTVKSINDLYLTEYTGWKAAKIFQEGGSVAGKGKQLTVLFDAAKKASGRRIFDQSTLRNMIAAKQVRFEPTPRGILIIQSKGGTTKKGNPRRGSRDIILGMLKRSIVQKKRLSFFENIEANSGWHEDRLGVAIENALVEVATQK